jgi:bacillithiol system protein YtxJ
MTARDIVLDSDPATAVETLRRASREHPVLVFKKSPICPVSHRAEAELERWLESLAESSALSVARVDVIAQRELARGLTSELGIDHESPQALWFEGGELTWHGSHGSLTRARFGEQLAASES